MCRGGFHIRPGKLPPPQTGTGLYRMRPCGICFPQGRIFRFLHKRIVKPSKPDRHGQADEQQHDADCQRDKIAAGKGAAGVPGALVMLAEAAQLHGVGDRVDAVQARQNQRQQDADRVLQALEERLTAAQLDAAGLLCLADAVVIALNIRNVPQRNGDGIADLL